ncbi:MAG: hypothetical protein POELPBGB_00740 [Bacteroidia bacterium]|nr:hypothetical protein [Bacteroidia bacterium]
MADFIKRADLQFLAQFENFSSKLINPATGYAALFGLSAAQLAGLGTDRDWLNFVFIRYTGVASYAQDWTKLKDQLRYGQDGTIMPPFPIAVDVSTPPVMPASPNIEGRFRALAGTIKLNQNYSKTIGEDLQIEAPDSTVDYSTYKPVFSLEVVAEQVLIRWKKLKSDGVNIYKKVNAAGGWVKIDFDGKPNYLDKSDMPPAGTTQQWTYRLRYVKNEVEIGEFSVEQTITVSGL